MQGNLQSLPTSMGRYQVNYDRMCQLQLQHGQMGANHLWHVPKNGTILKIE